MRTICGTILAVLIASCGASAALAVAAMVPTAVTAGGAHDFAGAKWIGANPVTLPDYDFGPAVWIALQSNETALTKTVVLPEKPETAELVVAAHGWFSVEINGMKRWGGACRDLAPCGDFHDWRYAKFVDAAPALREGTNTFRIVTKAAKGEDAAVLLSVLLPDGTRIATDGKWGGARVFGGPREVPWGREMVFRREVNSPRFRKSFVLPESVASARLSITGLGYYEATINGARVGRKRLDPIPSNYDKLVYYSTYDVAGMLRKGDNVIDVTLGHGWYDVRAVATWNWDMAPWRSPPKMIARIDVVTQSGERKTVVSDETWRQVESPIGFDCIREGEVIGARNKRAVDLERNVVNAVEVPAPKGRLEEETVPPTVVKRTVAVKSIEPVDGWWRIDFGEDVAGFMRMRFSDAVAGRTVVFRYDERDGITVDSVDKRDGVASAESAKPQRRIDCHFGWTASHDVVPGGVFQCDRYVTKGEEGEVYEPRFTYNGFRYVFVKGLGRAPKADECEAVVLQTDFQDIGSFSCSSPVFNGLVRMADRAYKSNFVNGFPTDCPHREKNGWTADAALAGEMAMYCYENTIAYKTWLRQVADSQRDDGWISEIVPTAGWGYHGLLDWDAVIAILPMDIYRYRGDAGALEEMYPTLTNYLEKAAIPFLDNGVFRRVRGDWVTAGTRPDEGIVGTCYFKLMCETAAFTARRLGDSAAAARYASYADAARLAFNRTYYRGNGVYGDSRGRQTTQGMALSFGMVPDSERKAVQAELVKAVEAADGHLDFGLHGMKWVPRALSEAGRSDLAFRMFTNETAPSPATWLNRGGTSLWEDWGNGASRNHIMFGEFVCWAYQYLAGIRLKDGATAFSEVVVEPRFIGDLEWVRASVKLPRGELSAAWSRKNGKTELIVRVPEGTRAFVRLPGGRESIVGPGIQTFVVEEIEVVRCRIPYQFDTFAATWAHASTFRSEATGLFLGAGEDDTEDCAIIAGLALSALVDKYDAERAKGVAKALLSLGTKIPGYVCRGVSRDGATVNRGSSRDQITHFVHGLYRYYESGMASRDEKDAIRGAFAALADRMIANVTEANGWNALDADGRQDAKGVLKMWNVHPHEAARLPMVYAAAWKTTGNERYREAYEKFVDEAIEQSWGVSKLSEQERKWQMPGYSFLQMNASLEVIRLVDSSRASKAEAVMKEVALLAARRFVEEKGADGPWLSAAGDLACAVAMVARIESIAKILGPELNEKWEKLADDCIFGLNGQPPLWESHPDRIFSLLSAKFRLGK